MYNIGAAAFSLGNYLQNTPVARIQKAYQKIPWGAVRKAILEQDSNLAYNVQQYVAEEGLLGDGL